MRRLLAEKNFFCTCGHLKRLHEGDDYSEWCAEYYTPNGSYPCGCPKFEIDNLRYLEAKAKEKDSERTKI